jgi:enolase
VIKEKYGMDATNVGDEGGFAPAISNPREGLELLKAAIEKAGYTGTASLHLPENIYADERVEEKSDGM